MRQLAIAVLTFASLALLLPVSAHAQRTAGAVSVGRTGERATTATTPTSRTPAARTPGQVRHSVDASVAIVLVPSLPRPEASAVILRRASRQPQNVVMITSSTTAHELARALVALQESRRSRGDEITRDMLSSIPPSRDTAPEEGARRADRSRSPRSPRPHVMDEAERVIAGLRTAPSVYVEGVGSHPGRVLSLGSARR